MTYVRRHHSVVPANYVTVLVTSNHSLLVVAELSLTVTTLALARGVYSRVSLVHDERSEFSEDSDACVIQTCKNMAHIVHTTDSKR